MGQLRISRAAQADLAAILAASRERWGEQGRARYAALGAAALRRVAAKPGDPARAGVASAIAITVARQ